MFTKVFWVQTFERAAKTAAQAALLVVGADAVNAFSVSWGDVAGFALGGAVLSALSSIASIGFGPSGTPSLVEMPSSPED